MRKETYRIRYLFVLFIVLYQKCLSPFLSPTCRFYPTCSTYACQALIRYGVVKGGLRALVRILKCHPFHPGGYDPLR